MFDIGFPELLLVGLVALLVFGPDRLPGAARMAGLWVGRLKRSFNAIKQEVEREIGADEIRRQLHNEETMALEQQHKSLLPSAAPASVSLQNPVATGTPIAVGSPIANAPISHDSPPPPRAP